MFDNSKIKSIIDLNKNEIFNICKSNLKCKDCDLNKDGWCIFKNSYDQMENYFGSKKMNEYLNKEVIIYG